jgi:hypothetical protein
MCEDRIRNAKDTGLRNLPLKGVAQNQLWCEIVVLACELIAWTQMLALTGKAHRWEPKRLRLRVFAVGSGGAGCGSDLPNAGPGPGSSPPRPPACRPSHLADQPEQPRRPGRRNRQDPWNPAHPERQPGNQARPHAENQPQPNTSGHQNRVTKDRG